MTGIKTSLKTKKLATLKIFNALQTYLFEQQYDELYGIPEAKVKKLQAALKVLGDIVKAGKY